MKTECDVPVRMIIAAPEMFRALQKADNRIAQLCSMVNNLAGERKVRYDDFAEEILAALKSARG